MVGEYESVFDVNITHAYSKHHTQCGAMQTIANITRERHKPQTLSSMIKLYICRSLPLRNQHVDILFIISVGLGRRPECSCSW